MHKETVNTFTKGMVKDTHPLTTPADILTDCLNGTIITYNGNEMILQNDMGNVKIGTAELPEGYIPIGVTEYGGIVYVASYNPSTGKGQIGSFPSPLLAHMSEMWSVNISTLTPVANLFTLLNIFYESGNNNIIRTEYKAYLGRNEKAEDVYMLHTGDKILIESPKRSSEKTLMQVLMDLSCILVQFAILKKDGSIEIVEGNYLDGELHVYAGKSSGYPLVIIKLLTLRSFNLERTYSRGYKVNNLDTVNITFTGKVEKEDAETQVGLKRKTGMSTNFSSLSDVTTNALSFTIYDQPMSGTFKYEVIPVLNPQGNLISMKKEGTIDLDKFRSDSSELKNWSYIIFDTYMKINWSFDYYNLDDDKEIKKVEFIFKSILGGGSTIIALEKDSFNGSFEEIINFDEGIYKNNIYIVEIVGYKGTSSTKVHLGNRMVYTSGIFNEFYGTVKDFTNKGFRDELPKVMWIPGRDAAVTSTTNISDIAFKKSLEVKITPTIKVTKTTQGNNVTITNPMEETIEGTPTTINEKDLTVRTDERRTGWFTIDISNDYKIEVELSAKAKLDPLVVGNIAEKTISEILKSFEGSKLVLTDESQLMGVLKLINHFTQLLKNYDQAGVYTQGKEFNVGTLKFEEDLHLESQMKVKATEVKSKVVERKGLKPLYYPNMSRSLKQKCFTAWNKDNPLLCAGADENDYQYNVTLAGGDISGGASTGAGCDGTGLNTAMEQMGLPMVSMAAGMDGDEGCYSPDETSADYSGQQLGLRYRRRTVAGWGNNSNEIDGGDNFLMAVWKLTDNEYRFTLLGSQKAYDLNKGRRLVRLDYMLRCLLSQIFTKQAYKESVKYVTTNSSEYGYYNPQIKVEVELEQNKTNYNDVPYPEENSSLKTNYDILLGDKTIESKLLAFKNVENGLKNDEIMTIKYDIHLDIASAETVFASDFGMEELSNLFTGAEYEESLNERDDKSSENWIYVVDWKAVDAAGKGNIYNILSDNTFEWKLSDMTPYLKLSGTADGSGYAYIDEYGSPKVRRISNGEEVIEDISDPLSTTSGSPGAIDVNIAGPSDYNADEINGYRKGGLIFNLYNYGDILRTWDEKLWPFYHSFLHVFKTYCQWKSETIDSDIFNEIVLNRDSGHMGEFNVRCMWRNNKDEDAPDMTGALGNSYNSIYARCQRWPSYEILENANYIE